MRCMTTFAVAILLTSSASGHHSYSSMDTDSVVAIEGTVSQFNWRNPHVYFTVETVNERGEQVEWTVQTDSTNIRARRGWTRESLSSGVAEGDTARIVIHAQTGGVLLVRGTDNG